MTPHAELNPKDSDLPKSAGGDLRRSVRIVTSKLFDVAFSKHELAKHADLMP